MLRLLDAFLPSSLREPRAGDADARRRARVLIGFVLLLAVAGIVVALGSLALDLRRNSAAAATASSCALLVLWRVRRGDPVAILGAVAGVLVLYVVVQGAVELGGIGAPPLNWLAVIPLIVLLISGPRAGVVFALLSVIAHVAFFVFPGTPRDLAPTLRLADGIAMALCVLGIALIYEAFKRRALAEIQEAQTKITALQAQLVDNAHAAGMSQIASSVAHSAGNALNHVATAAHLATEQVRAISVARLRDLARKLKEPEAPALLAAYVDELHATLAAQQATALVELARVLESVDHVTTIITSQLRHTQVSAVRSQVELRQILEELLYLERAGCADDGVELVAELEPVPPCQLSRHKLLIVAANLVRNAISAVRETGGPGRVRVRLHRPSAGWVWIEVHDTGVGIAQEHAANIFRHGFTTRATGHGFGLHGSAIAAAELGGTLRFHSAGRGAGATFVLELPFVP